MKRWVAALLILSVMSISIAGCGNEDTKTGSDAAAGSGKTAETATTDGSWADAGLGERAKHDPGSDNAGLQDPNKGADPATGSAEKQTTSGAEAVKVDLDLTVLGSTMVYAEVFNMIRNPDAYIGKAIKLKGPYDYSFYEGNIYHFVLVDGVDPCCPEGLMFFWSGEHTFPDDYPDVGTQIVFVGVFSAYDGFDFPYYCFLVDDLLLV